MKKKLFSLIALFIMFTLVIIGTIYAAFSLNKKIDLESQIGTITSPVLTLSYKTYDEETQEYIYQKIEDGSNFVGYRNGVISCYASKPDQNQDKEGYINLNQLKIEVEFNTNIDTRLRVKIQDSWISKKVYLNGTQTETVITKDWKTEDTTNNPFNFATDWTYDETTGYAYYNYIVDTTQSDETGNFEKVFLDSSSYFYQKDQGLGFREVILIDISFQFDLIQANRAKAVWGKSIPNASYKS